MNIKNMAKFNFVIFQKPIGGRVIPHSLARINNNNISFNTYFVLKNNLADYKYIQAGFDKDKNVIGFEFFKENDNNTKYKLSGVGPTFSFSCMFLFTNVKVECNKKKYVINELKENNKIIYYIDLNKPYMKEEK